MMPLILLWIAALLLLVTLLNVVCWPKVRRARQGYPGAVSILIPARDEEQTLPACLEAVLRQGEIVAEVLVYDDHSADGTATVVAAYRQNERRLRLVEASPLPAGWCGKNFACARLAAAARSEWLLFLDADARLAEGAVERIVDEARRRDLTLLSCWPGLRMEGFWEKTLMPLLNVVVFSLYPGVLALSNHRAFAANSKLGLAHGACLLVERRSYEEFGGHARVKEQIFEDTRLAQLWRADGRRGLGLDGQEVVSLRMYSSLVGIWGGFEKNFFPAFRREASFWAFWTLHAVVFWLPFPLSLWRPQSFAPTAACVLLLRILLTLRFRHSWRSVLLHPLAEVFLLALGLSSWWRCKSGRGVEWKGRRYRNAA